MASVAQTRDGGYDGSAPAGFREQASPSPNTGSRPQGAKAAPPLFPLAPMLRDIFGDGQMPRIRVVDVGAMFMEEGDDCWMPLKYAGLCEAVVGFEPNEEECEKLNAIFKASTETSDCSYKYLPYAIGDGSEGEFRLCSAPMTSSMLEPNIPLLRRFVQLEEVTTVVKRMPMRTRCLDDLCPELGDRVDFLKLDVQGYELAVLKGATKHILPHVLVVHTEVEFVEMYEKQPLFAEVDQFLRSAGFVFHRFASIHGRPMKPLHLLSNPLCPISQQMWADAVYVRDFWDLNNHSRDELIRTALILHEIYHSYDAVRHVLAKIDDGLAKRYLDKCMRINS